MANTTTKPPSQRRRDSTDRPPSLSRSASAASSSHGHLRPKSRGSTTSLQSVGVGNSFQPVQPNQQQHAPLEQGSYFVGATRPPTQSFTDSIEHPNMMAYQKQMQQMHQPQQMISPHDMRPTSQHGYANIQAMPMQYHDGMQHYAMPAQHMHHMRHASEHYEGSPAPEDSNNESNPKKRKGAASSLANDQELRRLLQQYQGRSLPEVAAEVQRNEGSGGKSEKAKQVFAMLWLQETCQRSNESVRRDRVFARYTERCGNERVPTLNPASFGKLVRIIFPNVQTRRLGVRGESKYHYVDLSLVPDGNDPGFDSFERPGTASGIQPERPASASENPPSQIHTKPMTLSVVPPRLSMETADFPSPHIIAAPRTFPKSLPRQTGPLQHKLDCKDINTPLIRISRNAISTPLSNALPSVRPGMPGTVATYLAMPSKTTLCQPLPSSQESPIDLPDIHEYLAGVTYDHHIAKLLQDLYRSYCIDVIDAFRKCKDKSFFNHHSAFNGKMTVPVSKLFNLECLAPWIQECDMRMYKQILRYMTPLVLQDVPEAVWNAFDRISQRLVSFLIASFEEKCPPHVVAAKAVPAARFTNLLRKLRSAQTSTLQLNRMLENPQTRQQMWLDACSALDPDLILQECNAPPESLSAVQGVLKHDLRSLLGPDPDPLVEAAEQDPTSSFARLFQDPSPSEGLLSEEDYSSDLLVRLVAWLECLPTAFEGHHPQCMLDWQVRFFRAILNQFGASGAISYQSWWYFDNFVHQMLSFITELEGLLLSSEDQKALDQREAEKKEEHTNTFDQFNLEERKRKRSLVDVGGDDRTKSPVLSPPNTAGADTEPEPDSARSASFPVPVQNKATTLSGPLILTPTTELPPPIVVQSAPAADEDDDDMAEIARGGPLDLPSFKTGFTSPLKPADSRRASGLHDDSGIGMDDHSGLDADALEAEKEAKKFNKRDWFLSSDPVEPGPGLAALVS